MKLLDAFLEDALTNPPSIGGSPVIARKDVFVAIRTDDVLGSGTPDDPYNGATDDLLDNLLSNRNQGRTNVTTNTTIRFGPGIFQTRGAGGLLPVGFQPLDGQRFIGSGIGQTTLQLVKFTPIPPSPDNPDQNSYGVGGIFYNQLNSVSDVIISDMTLDLNLSRQPRIDGSYDPAVAPAFITVDNFLPGANIVFRRVRIINWGPHVPLYIYYKPPTPPQPVHPQPPYAECFPLLIANATDQYIGENIVEDCIIEQPDLSPARETTLINNHSSGVTGPLLFATNRNNYLNADFTTGSPPPPIKIVDIDITSSSGNVIIRTKWPHCMQKFDKIWIENCSVSALNGRFIMSDFDPPDYLTLKFAQGGLSGNPNATPATVQRYVPQAMLVASLSATGGVATLTTSIPHKRLQDDYIRVSGAVVAGFNGAFKVKPSPTSTTLTFDVDPSLTSTAGTIWLDRWPSTYVRITDSNNPVDMGPSGGHTYNWEVVFTTADAHFKIPGDYVSISNFLEPQFNGWFRVVARVAGDWSRTSLRCQLLAYEDTTLPKPSNFGGSWIANRFQGISCSGGWGAICRANRLTGLTFGGPYHDSNAVKDIVNWDNYYYKVGKGEIEETEGSSLGHLSERNIFDLHTTPIAELNNHPAAFSYGTAHDSSNLQRLIIRKNIVRFADDAVDIGAPYECAADIYNGQCTIAHQNLITLPNSFRPLHWRNTAYQTIQHAFNNYSQDGKLVPGIDIFGPSVVDPHAREMPEIATDAEDVFLTL